MNISFPVPGVWGGGARCCARPARHRPRACRRRPRRKPKPPRPWRPLPPRPSPLPAGIDKALEKALDRKLAPIMRTLAEMQEQKVRMTDVLGGLGYIFGLVGVAAYFKRPRKG